MRKQMAGVWCGLLMAAAGVMTAQADDWMLSDNGKHWMYMQSPDEPVKDASFLGIGGGPINLVVLFFFFSMSTKTAAENSLYIIFFSQIASLVSSLLTGSVPEFQISMLVLMAAGGIGGGIAGRVINKRLTDRLVNRLFIVLMVVILFINIYNIYRFAL